MPRFGIHGAVWTKQKFLISTNSMGVVAARQIRTGKNKLLGVAFAAMQVTTKSLRGGCGSSHDIARMQLSTIDSTLKSFSSHTIRTFVVDAEGDLIASSRKCEISSNITTTSPFKAADCKDPYVSEVAKEMENDQLGWKQDTVVPFLVPGKPPVMLQVKPLRDAFGLKWQLVVIENVVCAQDYFQSTTGPLFSHCS